MAFPRIPDGLRNELPAWFYNWYQEALKFWNKLEEPPVGSLAPIGTTVVSETSYGQSPVVGTVQKYASSAHSHGTPALPNLSDLPSHDHGDLTGLSDDDHPQYLLLAGRTGQEATTPLKLGGATDYSIFEADGTLAFEGAATVWNDMRVPGTSARLGSSAPAVAAFLGAGGLYVLQFNGTGVANDIYFEIQMSHEYKEGTNILPHVHWTPTDTNTGNVVWYLEYSWANIGATFGASTTITSTPEAAGGTAWVHKVANFAAITGTGKTISSMLVCRLYRDPADVNDTYAHPAAFLEFDLHFEIDTVGSRQTTVK